MLGQGTFWLTLTNIVIAAVAVGAFLLIVLGLISETVARKRRRSQYEAELDRDMEEMFAHSLHSGKGRCVPATPVHRLRQAVRSICRRLTRGD